MFGKVESKKKLLHSIRPSVFSTSTVDITEFRNFLKDNQKKSINAKFLLEDTRFHHLDDFEKRFLNDLPLVKEIIAQEINRPEGTFAFYNGSSNAVKFLRMAMSAISKEMAQTDPQAVKSNLVFGAVKSQTYSPKTFFEKHLDGNPALYPFSAEYNSKKPLLDHETKIAKVVLAASMLLHDGLIGETAWLMYQRNMSFSISKESDFVKSILQEFCIKNGLEHFPIDTVAAYYDEYRSVLQAQLLQIFVRKESFNSLGYYCYAGGVPLVKDSVAFLDQLYSDLNKHSCSNWESCITERLGYALEEEKLYHLVHPQHAPSHKLLKSDNAVWHEFLQVRFLTANPDFYNSEEVSVNEYYKSDEAYQMAKKLKLSLKLEIQAYFKNKGNNSDNLLQETSALETCHLNVGTEGRSRTDTMSPSPDFESGASTNSATPAHRSPL